MEKATGSTPVAITKFISNDIFIVWLEKKADMKSNGSDFKEDCGRSSAVEHLVANENVEGSIPFARSNLHAIGTM